MAGRFVICLWLLASVATSAQSPVVTPSEIRCATCALTGQTPDPPGFDASQIDFVPKPIPVFTDNRTLRISLIARVVHAAPLMLEILDSTFQTLDRNMRVVAGDQDGGTEPGTCGEPERVATVDLASKPVVVTLGLNDIITGGVIMKRDERMPGALLAGTPVLTNVRKASAPVRYFHPAPVPAHCVNRSGRLVVYSGPVDGESTVVYNDGAIYHENAANLTFIRERLSAAELAELHTAFRAVNFDELPAAFARDHFQERPAIALIGARYQSVRITGLEARLAPLLARMDGVAARAMSHAQYILKRDSPIPLAIAPWPYPAISLDRFVDQRLRSAGDASEAWRAPVPDAFLASLPAAGPSDTAPSDPNRLVYFSQEGKLYRVARSYACAPAGPCPFNSLDAAEVAEPAQGGECTPGTTNCETTIYRGGRPTEHHLVDPNLTAVSGRFWPRAMGVRLRDLAPGGTPISTDEYARHKDIYFPLLRFRALGSNYIEDGLLYPRTRLCQIEPGSADACN